MLNENIKRYRKFKGWTQEKLANEFGLTRDNVASYERGIANPPLEIACKICDDISVSLHDLLYGDILNPKIESKRSDRVIALEQELQKAYRTIALMAQKNFIEPDDNELTKAAEE